MQCSCCCWGVYTPPNLKNELLLRFIMGTCFNTFKRVLPVRSKNYQKLARARQESSGSIQEAPQLLQELAEQLSISFPKKVKHQPQGHARAPRSTIRTPGPQRQDHARRSHSDFPVRSHPPTSDITDKTSLKADREVGGVGTFEDGESAGRLRTGAQCRD